MENYKGLQFLGTKEVGSNFYKKDGNFLNIKYNKDEDSNFVYSNYEHSEIEVKKDVKNGTIECKEIKNNYKIMTEKIKTKKLGILIIGIGGNNSTTMLGGICANAKKITYLDKYEKKKPNYLGSIFLSSNIRLGYNKIDKEHYYCPIYNLIELYNPENIVYGGWDINNLNLKDCLIRNKVFDYNLVEQIKNDMNYVPLKSVYFKGNFIAANQQKRVNNILVGNNKLEIMEKVRKQIQKFKKENKLTDIIVLWSGNTEKNIPHIPGINDTFQNILLACQNNHESISPSIIYALASILENCPFINSSPQNTLVNGVVELAEQKGIFIIGNDLKTGQTKIKNLLLDTYFGTGLKPKSIVSYNHLGNNDGKNLSSDSQFYSKKISKSNLICDYVKANENLYIDDNFDDVYTNKDDDYCKGDSLIQTNVENEEMENEYNYSDAIEKQKVNSEIVIKYIPYVGDDKKAMDEYISELFMNGKNTISLYNVCQDSLLASPILIDLILLVELSQRIYFKSEKMNENKTNASLTSTIKVGNYELKHDILSNKYNGYRKMNSVLFLSSIFCKSPFNSNEYKTRHSFFSQIESLLNFVRVISGFPIDAHVDLSYMV
ncbi:inositol-3-phosphate synthase, putative [Plasmodium yoelii]|uniref:inositol-3-phosphate synthase n=3 Tax=Plasmodium yoelii TaxID=5861 RepID=A0AAF0B550_PLAYO|nr:inositol-3-phosphate synthase, putative [Plasmodium yoelii]EAA15800.1 myo-inositol-1-phosphate synthase [Plasmodium yoelii yoelii]WBY58501.1 inositol-3-phosphate synthase [Plasmodium yoelii yoelii]CDU18817.1 inositol-3-phosphate synthase, putative [Plasmodium yoelii]VTZ79402.1 inositol-3-phosphate synthase, putative [Plasmodium yoelii]|eukprot:XP_724235.1 inositol-3-phosphate synthase, putative [Plasmodium yoelii]